MSEIKGERKNNSQFDLNRVDYDWIEKTINVKDLKKAYDALEEDGYFPDLLKVCGEKIIQLDPKFARRVNGETKISYEDEKKIKDDLNNFFENAKLIDNQLRNTNENQENQQTFSNGSKARYNQDSSASSLAEKLEREKIAENERLKGNEFVKAKEYSNAVGCYTRSIELNNKEPFTFANRAMAYLKMKLYKNAIKDSNSALELKPGYLKAIHRRGKAYAALGEYENAIKDFQQILEEEVDNKEVNKDLMDARTLLNKKIETEGNDKKKVTKEQETKVEEKKKFVRVAIEEDSDQEEEKEEKKKDEPIIQEITEEKVKQQKETKKVKFLKSRFPLKITKEIVEHSREAKKLMKLGAEQFEKKKLEYDLSQQKNQSAQLKEIIDLEIESQEKNKDQNIQSKIDLEKQKLVDKQNQAKKLQQELAQKQKELENAQKEAKKAFEAQKIAEEKAKKEAEDLKRVEQEVLEKKKKIQKDLEKKMKDLNNDQADESKKDQKRVKLDGIFEKCETKKSQAAEQFKLGQYGDAIKTYQQGVNILENALEDFSDFQSEIYQLQATFFNNMAACCKKELNTKLEIEFTSKVINLMEYISDKNLVLKAYLRRGLAYELSEKFLLARDDMLSVKNIQIENKQAQQALSRINKILKEIHGQNVPEAKNIAPVQIGTKQENSQTSKKEEKKQEQEKIIQENKKPQKNDQIKEQDFEKQLQEIKDSGNQDFKKKSYIMAISKFTEGVNLYLKNVEQCKKNQDIMIKVTQIYTNRALAWHNLGNQDEVIKDSSYVLQNIDAKNPKALYRRSFGLKSKGKLQEAIEDLQNLVKFEPENQQAKKELDDLLKLKQTEKTSNPNNNQKIQEIIQQKNGNQEQNEDTQEPSQHKKPTGKTISLDKETVEKASELASQEASNIALSKIPKTSAGFIKDFKQLKKDAQNLYKYIRQISVQNFESLFKKNEIEVEIFERILNVLNEYGLQDKESSEHTSKFLISLSKSSNFEMTWMFTNDKEKKLVLQIIQSSVKQLELDYTQAQDLVKKLKQIYN